MTTETERMGWTLLLGVAFGWLLVVIAVLAVAARIIGLVMAQQPLEKN